MRVAHYLNATSRLFGSGGRARTADILVNSEALYQLSYTGIVVVLPPGLEPGPTRYEGVVPPCNTSGACLGWTTGLEPATTGITTQGSTIDLRPPLLGVLRDDERRAGRNVVVHKLVAATVYSDSAKSICSDVQRVGCRQRVTNL